MKPVYFPFTFIPPAVLEDIRIFFPQIVIYQPSSQAIPEFIQKMNQKGLLDIRTPFMGDEEKLNRLVREYKDWIEQHKGSETAFFKTKLFNHMGFESIPMFSDTSTSQIKADIKKGSVSDIPQKPDPVFTARLFVLIAQEFDIQNNEFKQDMEKFQVLEKRLFSDIRGDDEFTDIAGKPRDAIISDDPGIHKTGQRLAAWLKLFEKDPIGPDESGAGFFITSSSGVLEHIMEICPQNEMVYSTGNLFTETLNPDQIAGFQKILKENLIRILHNGPDKDLLSLPETGESGKKAVNLKIYRFPRQSPWTLFKEKSAPPEDAFPGTGGFAFQNMFIGIMECMEK